jgi:hypothetical protein
VYPDFKSGISQSSKHIQILGSRLFNPAHMLGRISSWSRATMVFISSRPLGSYAPLKVMSTPACSRHQKKLRLYCEAGKRCGNRCMIPLGIVHGFISEC